MPIIKQNCPTCKKPAITKSEFDFGGMRTVMYQCGHADIQKKLDRTSFEDFISSDGKRPYKFQVDGALFGIDSNAICLIADEMGLGKTVQACMILWSHRQDLTRALVLCKAGLKVQWSKEIPRWCGEDWLAQIVDNEFDYISPAARVIILSFDTLWRFKDIPQFITKAKIKTVIMDEVQHLKNSGAKRTNGVREACKLVNHKIALSGTPIANHSGEYFPILNILHPERYRTKSEFEQIYVDTYWNGHSMRYGGLKDVDRFRRDTGDFIIRRTRAEVLPDLPAISRDYRFSELRDKVEQAYKAEFKQFQDYYNYGSDDNAIVRQSNIMAYLSKMRHITGIAKIEPCCLFLEDFIAETDRKIVVFTHHKDVQKLLHDLILDRKIGSVLCLPESPDLRQAVIDNFRDSTTRILLASTLASSEGTNMQFCNDAIMLERQWTPIKEEQAEARFPRPGQTADKINITYMVAVGTVDEFLSKLVEQKRQYVSQTLDGTDCQWDESSLMRELAEVLAQNGGKKWGW